MFSNLKAFDAVALHYPTHSSSLQSQLSVDRVCYIIDLADLQVTASPNDRVQYNRAESYAIAQERSRFHSSERCCYQSDVPCQVTRQMI